MSLNISNRYKNVYNTTKSGNLKFDLNDSDWWSLI